MSRYAMHAISLSQDPNERLPICPFPHRDVVDQVRRARTDVQRLAK